MSKSHHVSGEEKFEDFIISDVSPKEKVYRVQAMELEPTDVVIASYPKTGTTFIQEIVYLIRNHCDLDARNETPNVRRIPYMELGHADSFTVWANLPHPRNMKTHLPYSFLPKTARDGGAKVVYIIRNPKDTLVSYYHFYRMNKSLGNFQGSWNEFFNYFMQNNAMLVYGNPFDHFKGFLEHKCDANLCIVFYENLIQEPKKYISDLAKFLGVQLSEVEVEKIVDATSFDVMKDNPMTNMDFGPRRTMDPDISPFMRKGKVGDWKNYFTDEQNTIIDQMAKDRMKDQFIEFIYE